MLQDAGKFVSIEVGAGFAGQFVVINNFTAVDLQKFRDELQQRGALLGCPCVSWSPISVQSSLVSDADGVRVVHITMRCWLAQCLSPDYGSITLDEIMERGRPVRALVLQCSQ